MGLMPMQVREVIRLLEKHEWVEMRSRGSHVHFKHPNQALVITVPGNEGKELVSQVLRSALKCGAFTDSCSEPHSPILKQIFASCFQTVRSPHGRAARPAPATLKSRRGLRPPRRPQQFSCWPASVATTVVLNFP